MTSTTTTPTAAAGPRNEVRLRGRLPEVPVIRTLPSGDEVAVWRLVVRRVDETSTPVDTIDCEGYARKIVRNAARWPPGVIVEVEGSLRRRFCETPGGARSRYTVEVAAARRVRTTKELDDPPTAV